MNHCGICLTEELEKIQKFKYIFRRHLLLLSSVASDGKECLSETKHSMQRLTCKFEIFHSKCHV